MALLALLYYQKLNNIGGVAYGAAFIPLGAAAGAVCVITLVGFTALAATQPVAEVGAVGIVVAGACGVNSFISYVKETTDKQMVCLRGIDGVVTGGEGTLVQRRNLKDGDSYSMTDNYDHYFNHKGCCERY